MLTFAIFEGLPEAKSERLVSTEWPSVGFFPNMQKIRKSMKWPSRLDETLTFVIAHSASTKR